MNVSNATELTILLISYLQMGNITAGGITLSSRILAETTQFGRSGSNQVCLLIKFFRST